MFAVLNTPKPGIWRNGTRAEAAGRWFDGNLVRWLNGRLRPVGGWQLFEKLPLSAPARGGVAWRDNSQLRWLSLGTAKGLFIHNGGELREITPAGFQEGRVDSVAGVGYGMGTYNFFTYGTPRPGVPGDGSNGLVLEASTWTVDTFGELLVAVATSDGRVYEWDPAQWTEALPADRLATPVLNAPTNNTACFVTAERHLVLLGGSGNPRRVQWSGREDRTLWIPDATNAAGDFELATAGKIMRGLRFKSESIIFTDTDVHRMSFLGQPLVYGFEQISKGVDGLIGPNAVTEVSDRLCWMGASNFWLYDGVVRMLPCDVHDYVYGDVNLTQGYKFCAGHNVEFGEVWFFYCSASAIENDRYVVWSYKDNWWSIGKLNRTTWVPREIWPYAIATSAGGYLYQHEQGWTNNGASRVGDVFAESAALVLGEAAQYMDVQMLMPDADSNEPGTEKNVSVEFRLKENPIKDYYRLAGPYVFDNTSGYAQARFSARVAEMRVEAIKDNLFTFGKLRAEIKPGGGR